MQIHSIRSVTPAIRAAGGDPAAILARFGLTPGDLDDVDRRVPTLLGFEIARAASEATGDPHFGLHWGASQDPTHLGAVGYVIVHSPDVRTALANLCRYLHLVCEGLDVHVECERDDASIRYRPLRDFPFDLRHNNEHIVAFVVRLLQAVVDPSWRPREIRFRHPQPPTSAAYAEWLDVPIRFECDYNEVVFERELLERRNPRADETLLPVLERHVSELLARQPSQNDVVGGARAVVAQSLAVGDVNVDTVAERLGTSARTLQRRLADASVSFRELVDQVRRDVAKRYLESTDASLTEIAFVVGYSEVSALTRAFRRWTDMTPAEFRRARTTGE